MASKDKFVDKCIKMCAMSENDIIKTILKDNLKYIMSNESNDNTEEFPRELTGIDILKYKPSEKTFPDFALYLCTSGIKKEDIIKEMISNDFDEVVNEKRKAVDCGRRTRSKRPIVEEPKSDIILPRILSLFTRTKTDGSLEPLYDIDTIIDDYFPGNLNRTETIYSNEKKNYVIIVSDGIDGNWRSNGRCNTLTWKYPCEYPQVIFNSIVHRLSTVHVIRKRNGELRYMGKCKEMDEVNGPERTCVMNVS